MNTIIKYAWTLSCLYTPMLKASQLQGNIFPVVLPLIISLPDQWSRSSPLLLYSHQQSAIKVPTKVQRETQLYGKTDTLSQRGNSHFASAVSQADVCK